MFLKRWFCRHEWKIISEIKRKITVSVPLGWYSEIKDQDEIRQVIVCDKCGAKDIHIWK